MLRRRALAPTAVLLLSCLAAPAWAQQPGPDPQPAPTATELRDKGRAALASGDTAGACLLFEQSYQAAAKPGATNAPAADEVLFDLAECHEKLGKAAIAAAEYEQIASGSSAKAAAAKDRAAKLRSPTKPEGPAPQPPATAPAGPVEPPPATTATPPPAPPPEKDKGGLLPIRLGDFMDTRLSWTFGDDDVLHATGVAQPLSPDASVADRKTYRLFFDNLNSRFGGRENLTHLALYKKMPGFIDGLDTEASLIVRLDVAELAKGANNLNKAIYDAGTYIRAFYHTDGKKDGKAGLGLTLYPLDTDRMRLGYLYDISWGGTAGSINQSIFPRIQGGAPGGKLEYAGNNWGVFVGLKTAQLIQTELVLKSGGSNEVEAVKIGQTNYGALFGANVEIADMVRIDVGAGYFQQGKFDLPGVFGKPVYTIGESARVVVHHKDMPAPRSVDFLLYRNDPNKPQIIFAPEVYTPGKTTWAVTLEEDVLAQNLADFEVAGQTRLQPAIAGAVTGTLKSGYLRASIAGIFRDLPFVLRNQPSFIPFQTVPKSATTQNELFFAASLDYHIAAAHLTPGFGAGLQFPAQFKTSSVDADSSPINRTVVIREQGNIAILPLNRDGVPIFQARVSLKWELSSILGILAWVQYVRDNNGTFIDRDPNEGTVTQRTFLSPDFLGFGLSAQARF